jgi:hypothetical protein
MTLKTLDGHICIRRIDFIDSIQYMPKHKLCQIWYNYEPKEYAKNYQVSVHTLDKQAFKALVHAWQNGESVVLEEAPRPASFGLNQEMQHEIFKEPV